MSKFFSHISVWALGALLGLEPLLFALAGPSNVFSAVTCIPSRHFGQQALASAAIGDVTPILYSGKVRAAVLREAVCTPLRLQDPGAVKELRAFFKLFTGAPMRVVPDS